MKYGKIPAKEAEEIQRYQVCEYIVGPYFIRRKVQKENIILKVFMAINPVTGWSKIMQYNDKRAISITNLVETTWMSRHTISLEIT